MVTVSEPMMSTEAFEELARVAYRVADGLRLEFVGGKLSAKPVPDGTRGCIVAWLIRSCVEVRPELWLSTTAGLVVGSDRAGRVRPDGVLADADAFVAQGEWADPAPVLMVVEVTPLDADAHHQGKPRAYAEAGIPVYLLIDRHAYEVAAYSEPAAGRYTRVLTVAFGAELPLPSPVGITLDTEPLKRWSCHRADARSSSTSYCRCGEAAAELRTVGRRSFVPVADLLRSAGQQPPIDYGRVRADLDVVIDQDPFED
ncbi:Uma2 family endonuclease [Nocardia brasiliensis]|uniref:Uma2 family endonuclease n=1 Tax=Nocardia brasiliensis TaxID=37326 RepID=UPI00245481A7|nr:Uma2 family endonuclease [Nocardia brasiliensis]